MGLYLHETSCTYFHVYFSLDQWPVNLVELLDLHICQLFDSCLVNVIDLFQYSFLFDGLMVCCRCLLYHFTTLGSSHLSQNPAGFVMFCVLSNPNSCAGISIHTTWWLLIITLPKFRKPPWILSTSCGDMKMLSIAMLPHWCIGVFAGPCNMAFASTKLVSVQNSLILGARTSSFMSIRSIMWSPSSCHCCISAARSIRNSSFGHWSFPF